VRLLEGKTVLVTGASAGIGRATAIASARHGADVAINYVGDDGLAESCVAAIEAEGGKGLAVKGDVADPKTASAFVEAAVAALGRVDVFISNAGICPFHAFLDMPPELLRRTVGVKAPARLTVKEP